MRRIIIIGFVSFLLTLISCNSAQEKVIQQDLTQYVNTLIGTQPWSGKIQVAEPELAKCNVFASSLTGKFNSEVNFDKSRVSCS